MRGGTYCLDCAKIDYADQRYYNSNAGRFYTPDPAGMKAVNFRNPTSWNRYAYVGDDPINFTDPSGLVNWRQVGIGIAALGGGIVTVVITAAAEAGSFGAATPVAIFSTIAGANGIVWGQTLIAQGLIDNPAVMPPITTTVSNLVTGAPGSLIGAAVSGGNPTAIAAGATVNTVASVLLGSNLNEPSSAPEIVSLLQSAAQPGLEDMAGVTSDVLVNSVPTVINVSGTSTTVDPVASPVPVTISGAGWTGPVTDDDTDRL